jgi:hypothetical protein
MDSPRFSGKRERDEDNEKDLRKLRSRFKLKKCPACYNNHNLHECWHTFPDLRPDNHFAATRLLNIIKERIKENLAFKAKVKAARKIKDSS